MKQVLTLVSWVGVVLGALSMLDSFSSGDPYSFFGGLLFFLQGALSLKYISQVNKGE